jgi:hypothetical protein
MAMVRRQREWFAWLPPFVQCMFCTEHVLTHSGPASARPCPAAPARSAMFRPNLGKGIQAAWDFTGPVLIRPCHPPRYGVRTRITFRHGTALLSSQSLNLSPYVVHFGLHVRCWRKPKGSASWDLRLDPTLAGSMPAMEYVVHIFLSIGYSCMYYYSRGNIVYSCLLLLAAAAASTVPDHWRSLILLPSQTVL